MTDLATALTDREAAESDYFTAASRRRIGTERWVAAALVDAYPTAVTLKAFGQWVTMDDFALRAVHVLDAAGQNLTEGDEEWNQVTDEIDPYLSTIADLGGPEHRQFAQEIDLLAWRDQPLPPACPGYCPWCEEADSPVYRAHEGHDPECPLQEGA